MAMDNIMTHWVGECTRLCGNYEPSRLELVFTKEMGMVSAEPLLEKVTMSKFSLIKEGEKKKRRI